MGGISREQFSGGLVLLDDASSWWFVEVGEVRQVRWLLGKLDGWWVS